MPFDTLPDHHLQIRNEQYQPLPARVKYPILPLIAQSLQPLVQAASARLDPEARQRAALQELQIMDARQKLQYSIAHPELMGPQAKDVDPLLEEKRAALVAATEASRRRNLPPPDPMAPYFAAAAQRLGTPIPGSGPTPATVSPNEDDPTLVKQGYDEMTQSIDPTVDPSMIPDIAQSLQGGGN